MTKSNNTKKKEFKIYDLNKGEHPPSNMPDWLKWLPLYMHLEFLRNGMPPNEEKWNYVCQLAKECDEYYAKNPELEKEMSKPKKTIQPTQSNYSHSNSDVSFRSIELAPCPPEWQALERNRW